MVNATIRRYAMIRSRFVDWEEFTSKHSWASVQEEKELPENCIAVYYPVDLEQKKVDERLCMVTYSRKYQPGFKKISIAWLEEFFSVEGADLHQLDTPEECIIIPGGELICMLNEEEEVVGTVAMIVEADGAIELAKMGVGKQYNGKGYAHALMKEAVVWAKSKSYTYINLYTAKKLKAAVSLYEKHGFQVVPFTPHSHFTRVDLVMRLTF